jgi:hypothetical protein
MLKLTLPAAVCIAALMVGQATADTLSPFTVNGTFTDPFKDIFALTGTIDVDATTGTFDNASLRLVGEPWTNITSQGSVGSFYDLNVQTPIFNTGCSPSYDTGAACHDTLTLMFAKTPLMLLADQGGLITGGFSNLRDAGFSISLVSGSLEAASATPIPAALPFFIAGLGGIGLLARRRHRLSGKAGNSLPRTVN